ncbi:protein amalgam-like isoform X2 [Branchiostoma floridae x Branchiostoma belcheri]
MILLVRFNMERLRTTGTLCAVLLLSVVVGSFGQTTVSNSAIGLKVSPTVDAVAGQPITLKATYQSTRSIVSLIWSKVEGDVGGRRAPVFVHYPGSEYSYGDLTGRADRTNGVSLRISRVKPSDEGYYVVQLLLDAVGQEEKEVYLNVLEPPKVYVGPGSPYVVRWGKNITLSCRVKAKPEITNLYWEKDGLPVRSFPRSKKYRGGNMRNPNLHVINVGKADAGKYGCVIDHVVESTRATLDLEVLYPASITSLTESVSVALTDTITLQCFADGNPEPNITWTKEGAPVERMREIQTFSKGLRASALVLNYAERNDSGKYICTASNGLGKPDVRTLTLNVEGERALNSYTQIAIFAGAAAGGAWLIVCIILVIVYVRRRNQQRLRDDFAYYYAVGRRHFEYLTKKELPPIPPHAAAAQQAKKMPKNAVGRLARVVHKYAPQAEDELMLEVDDVLEIVKTDEGGWWVGYLKGKLGLFPFNYVDLLPEKASMGNGKAKSPLRADLTDSEYQALDPPQKQGPDRVRDSISLPDPLTGDSFSKATTLVAEKKEKDNPNLVACSGNR